MRLPLFALLCLLPGFASAQSAAPIRMLDPVPYARENDVPDRIKNECTGLGHDIALMVSGLARGKVTLVQGKLPTSSAGQVLQLEITDVVSDGNAFIGQNQSIRLRGTLYHDGKKVAGFVARRSQQADLFKACANLQGLAANLGRDISRWLKDPKDGAELGRSWF